MIEYYTHAAGHNFEGVEILRYRIVLPCFSDSLRISDFYREIYDKVLCYCERELTSYSEEKYLECDLPKKKFEYRPLIYRLEGRATCAEGDLLFVKLTASVMQRGLTEPHVIYDAHAWSLSDERLIPPKMAAREYFGSRYNQYKRIGKNGFLVENGKPYVCCGNTLRPLEFIKKVGKGKDLKAAENS